MIRASISLSSIALLLFACERETPQAPPAAAAAATPVAVRAPEPAAEVDDAVAVEEDFEQEAEARVNAANLSATLDELEKEIDSQ